MSENSIEVLSKGRSFSSNSFKRRAQSSEQMSDALMLEYLPPEAPYFTFNDDGDSHNRKGVAPPLDDPDDEDVEEELVSDDDPPSEGEKNMLDATDQVYDRIYQLTEQVQDKLKSLGGGDAKLLLESHGIFPLSSPSSGAAVGEESDVDSGVVKDCSENNSGGLQSGNVGTDENRSNHALKSSSKSSDSIFDPVDSKSEEGDEKVLQFEDPKVQRAYKKMLKLDEKLADLSKREREVKRQRKLLEEEMEREGIISQSSDALVKVEDVEDMSSPKLFATQPSERVLGSGGQPAEDLERILEEGSQVSLESEEPNGEGKKRKKPDEEIRTGKDFIKRNKELVADAGALVMMTKAEKQRLQELLSEDQEADEQKTEEGGGENIMALCIPQPSKAFAYCDEDLERMRNIDNRLQALLPAGDWESLCAPPSPRSDTSSSLQPIATTSNKKEEKLEQLGEMEKVSSDSKKEEEMGSATSSELQVKMEKASSDSKKVEGVEEIGNTISSELVCLDDDGDDTGGERTHHRLHLYNERERLKLIEEKLRLIHEENQKDVQEMVSLHIMEDSNCYEYAIIKSPAAMPPHTVPN